MKIRTTFIIVFMLFAAGIAATGTRYYHHLEKYLYVTRLKELSAIAELKVRDISSWRSERLADAQVLAMNPAVAEFIKEARSADTGRKAKFTQWLDTFRNPYGYEGVLIVDPEGAELASVPHWRSLDPILKTILSPSVKPAVFSDFYRGSDGKPSLAVCAPIRPSTNPAAPPLGYVVLYIDPARFLYPSIQKWPTPSATGETMLVARDKDQVVYLNELRHQEGGALNLRLPLSGDVGAQAVMKQAGEMEGIDYRGVPVLAAFRRVTGSGWAIVAKVDRERTLSPLRQSQILVSGLVLALIAGSGAVFLYLFQKAENRSLQAEREAQEERELAHAARQQELRFRQLAEAVPQLVWMASPDGRTDFANSRWFELAGISVDDLLGKGWLDLLHPEDRDLTARRWSESVMTGRPYETTFRFRQADGGYRWYLGRGLPLTDDDGRIIRWVGTCTDITEMKQMEQEREMYIHMISHDLRSPLAAVHGFAYLLASVCTDAESREHAAMILLGVERALALTEDLVDAARLEGGQFVLRTEMVDLASFFGDLIQRNAPILGSDRIRVNVAESTPSLLADRLRLERVILNLLTNALKYSPTETPVELTAKVVEEKVVIAVADRGSGIAPEDLPYIFERFYLAKHGRVSGGVGLGLYITRKLVEAHGGSVEVESGSQQGTIFRIILPTADKNVVHSGEDTLST